MGYNMTNIDYASPIPTPSTAPSYTGLLDGFEHDQTLVMIGHYGEKYDFSQNKSKCRLQF